MSVLEEHIPVLHSLHHHPCKNNWKLQKLLNPFVHIQYSSTVIVSYALRPSSLYFILSQTALPHRLSYYYFFLSILVTLMNRNVKESAFAAMGHLLSFSISGCWNLETSWQNYASFYLPCSVIQWYCPEDRVIVCVTLHLIMFYSTIPTLHMLPHDWVSEGQN